MAVNTDTRFTARRTREARLFKCTLFATAFALVSTRQLSPVAEGTQSSHLVVAFATGCSREAAASGRSYLYFLKAQGAAVLHVAFGRRGYGHVGGVRRAVRACILVSLASFPLLGLRGRRAKQRSPQKLFKGKLVVDESNVRKMLVQRRLAEPLVAVQL